MISIIDEHEKHLTKFKDLSRKELSVVEDYKMMRRYLEKGKSNKILEVECKIREWFKYFNHGYFRALFMAVKTIRSHLYSIYDCHCKFGRYRRTFHLGYGCLTIYHALNDFFSSYTKNFISDYDSTRFCY